MKYPLWFLLFALFLSGCRHDDKPTPPNTVLVEKSVAFQCGTPPTADPYKALPVQWLVGTLTSGEKVFALTGPAYENHATNLSNVAASAAQVAKQRDFWKDCVERSQKDNPPAPAPKVGVTTAPAKPP